MMSLILAYRNMEVSGVLLGGVGVTEDSPFFFSNTEEGCLSLNVFIENLRRAHKDVEKNGLDSCAGVFHVFSDMAGVMVFPGEIAGVLHVALTAASILKGYKMKGGRQGLIDPVSLGEMP